MDAYDMLLQAKRYCKPDEPKDFGFIYSHFSGISSGSPFEGCELSIDEDHKVIYIEANGYEVTVALGNTPEWTTPSRCGGFEGALEVSVKKEEDFDEDPDGTDNRLFHHILPIRMEE